MSTDEKTLLYDSSSVKESIQRTPEASIGGSLGPTAVVQCSGVPHSLPWYRKLAFGVGHVFNDLCASMWFTYLILFYHKVLELDNALAGTLLLIGQAADGIATPIIGYLCDITPFWYKGFGRRKFWHLIGTILVALSLFFFWHRCLPCILIHKHVPMGWHIVWYAVFIVIFQVGWASVQISHLSLIPELTKDENERVGLNAIRWVCLCSQGWTVVASAIPIPLISLSPLFRTSFTILSNLGVFVAMWVLLELVNRSSRDITSHDEWVFSVSAQVYRL